MNILRQTVRRWERLEALDKVARPLTGAVGRAVRPRVVRNLLSGTYLGEPQHPVLTDLPIGAWVMSALLDAVGGPAAEGAADLLVTAGVVAAVPTAAAGLDDWSDTAGPETRVGLVHATLNTTALSLYLASLVARARGKTARRPGAGPGRAGGADRRRVPGRAPVLRPGRECQPHRVGAAAESVDAGAADTGLADGMLPQGRRGLRAGPAVPDRGNGVRPGQHLQSHGRATGGGHHQRRLRHLPVARQHLPVRRRHHCARPGQHAAALLPDAHPGRAHRGPRRHIGVAYLNHRRVVTEDTVLRASNGPDRRGCSITGGYRATTGISDRHVARQVLQSASVLIA